MYLHKTLEIAEIAGLKKLQADNLKINLSQEQAEKEGFLTFQYSADLIQTMMQYLPQPVFFLNDELVAYALAASREACMGDANLEPMIAICENLQYKGKPIKEYSYYTIGQICISEAHRGKGLFKELYLKHKELFAERFDMVVTEISAFNYKSQKAHAALGFETIHQYQQGETLWNVVVWDFKTKS